MNTNQFYYAKEVLGISSLAVPNHLKNYHLRLGKYPVYFSKKKLLLYFSETTDQEFLNIVKNINKALKNPEYFFIEIKKGGNHKEFILHNLLSRFKPFGFVIFGDELAKSLVKDYKTSFTYFYEKKASAMACVLKELSQYTGSSPDIIKNKQSAWEHLKVFARS